MLRKLARKWWFWVGLAGCLLLALAVGGVYAERTITRSRGEAMRDAIVRQLDAENPNWRAHDLTTARNAALPPPEQNAGQRALKAVSLAPQSYQDWTRSEKLRADMKPGVLPYEGDIRKAAAVHAECGEALGVARTVRDLPRGGFSLTYKEPDPVGTPLDNTQKMREAASLLSLDVIVLAHQGRVNEAIGSTHAILNCGRAIGDEPFSISQLVRIAIIGVAVKHTELTLGWGEPDAGLAELQAAFAVELIAPRLTYGFRGERAMLYRYLENMDEGRMPLNEDILPGDDSPLKRAEFWLFRKHLPRQQALILNKCNDVLAADKLPAGPARRQALQDIPFRDDRTAARRDLIAALLTMSWDTLFEAEDRTRATLGTAIAALACERYRRKVGRWPDSLQAIPKDILPEVPTDPYTGQPLLYAVTEDGAVVYATGKDLADNGGVNLDPKGDPETDIGFRLFNPDKRRQPPLPRTEPEGDPSPDNPGVDTDEP